MLSLLALVLISFGGYCVYLAFKPGYQTFGPLVFGVALIALGFLVLPSNGAYKADVYYRK